MKIKNVDELAIMMGKTVWDFSHKNENEAMHLIVKFCDNMYPNNRHHWNKLNDSISEEYTRNLKM